MKLSKLIKKEYNELTDHFPFKPTPKGFYRSGFEDGVLNAYLAMKHIEVNPKEILQVIMEIDPEGETIALELAQEEYEKYEILCEICGENI